MSKQYKFLSLIISIIILVTIILFFWMRPSSPDFGQYEAGKARKNAFFTYFLPIIKQENVIILTKREQLLTWQEKVDSLGRSDKKALLELSRYYRMIDFEINNPKQWLELLNRVNAVPVSLALAQAANESAWGTSRFAVDGRNYFGQWCFKLGCGLVPNKRDGSKAHEVAVFDSPKASVTSYLRNLNSHPAYAELRFIRTTLINNNQKVTGTALADGLLSYSERGELYITELRDMIRFNNLEQYD